MGADSEQSFRFLDLIRNLVELQLSRFDLALGGGDLLAMLFFCGKPLIQPADRVGELRG